MKIRFAATALLLGLVPAAPALADPFLEVSPRSAVEQVAPGPFLGVHDDPEHTRCPMSSAAEGNANQQHFPVKQYGQTAGGTRC